VIRPKLFQTYSMEKTPKTTLKASVDTLKNLQFRLTRRLLFAWIKPTILGGDRESLHLSDSDLICYVLPHRSIADLLVTDMACERGGLSSPVSPIPVIFEDRAVFFLGHPEGTFGRKTLRTQSRRMTGLLEHQQTLKDQTIKIVPVSLFWGHQPDREKSIFKLLLSENWSATSGMKKFLAMVFHPRHILVEFGRPIHLDELIASEQEKSRQVRKLMRLLRVHFTSQRQAIIGPDLSHRRTLLNTILAGKEVRAAIDDEAMNNNDKSILSVEKKAMHYAKEIASDQSYRVIRLFDVLLTWLWNNLYGGIELNDINIVKQYAQSHEIVYAPCHRSHIDYLLLSYVLYHNGLTPPHIAAGKNLNLPVVGPLLRRAGAFFMRRTLKGDPLYKAVFDEYLHQMFIKGYSVEYFIEGGRSRTGRTLPPRTGMLSMTMRSFQKDSTKPIAFIPVYFGYEHVLESSTYRAELSGNNKKTESVFDVFKVFSSFKHELGQVTVNFGEPVLLREFLDQHLHNWEQPAQTSASDFSATCSSLANTLVTNINTAVAIKPTNLVALVLLSTARQNIEENHLLQQVDLLREIALSCGPTGFTMTTMPAPEILEQAIEIVGLTRSVHQFGNIISASPEQSVNLTYNANNVLHVYAIPSIVARFVRTENRTTEMELEEFVKRLFPYLKAEMFLPWHPDDLHDLLNRVTQCLVELGVITRDAQTIGTPPPETLGYSHLQDIASITNPTLERFYIVLALLQKSASPSPRELETACSGIAEQLSVLYGINSPDFFEKSLFSTFLTTLQREQTVDSDLNRLDSLLSLAATTARTLNATVRYNILQAVGNYRNQKASDQEPRTKTS